MTLFGKILALLTAALGILMFAWALGIYTQRIDWTTTKASATQPAGELTKRLDRINQLKTALQGARPNDDAQKKLAAQSLAPYRQVVGEKPREEEMVGGAENRWRTAFVQLRRWETYRDQVRPWYAQQLQSLESGGAPVKALVYNQGQLVLTPQGVPQLQDFRDSTGKEILPRTALYKQLQETQQTLNETLARISKLIKEEQALTEQLAGETGNGGLRGEVDKEVAKTMKVKGEQEDLRPQLVNTAVQAEILQNRQRRLAERVEELKKARTTTARRE